MKKIIIGFIAMFIIVSCSNDELSDNSKEEYFIAKNSLIDNIKKVELLNRNEDIKKRSHSVKTLNFNEEEKEIVLKNSIRVFNSQGINNDVIIQEFGSLDNPEIVLTALAMTRIIDVTAEGRHIIDLETGYNYSIDVFSDSSQFNNSLSDPSVFDCAMDALGIPAGLILGSAKNLTQGALLKAAKKLATRTLGWIGAGIAIYEFGDCMNWW